MTTSVQRLDVGRRMAEAAVYNGIAFLAGQVAETNSQAEVGIQTKECLDRIDAILERLGSDKTRILSATIYLADMADYDTLNQYWDAWVPQGNTPARACVQARLAGDEFRVEISIVAAV